MGSLVKLKSTGGKATPSNGGSQTVAKSSTGGKLVKIGESKAKKSYSTEKKTQKPAVTTDVSGEAWTRATPSQTKTPERNADGSVNLGSRFNNTLGQYGAGNIDLRNRPQYKNEDGSISTVDGTSFNIEGKEVLLPSVWMKNGNPYHSYDDNEIIQHYYDTGEYLGKFDSVQEANEYAQQLHLAQEYLYLNTPQAKPFDISGEAWTHATPSQTVVKGRNQPSFTQAGTVSTGAGRSHYDGYHSLAAEVSGLESRKKRLEDERIRAQAEIAEGIGNDTSRYDAVSSELADVRKQLDELNKIRPEYDADKAKSMQDAFTSAENALAAKRGSVDNAVAELERLGTSISAMETNLEGIAAQFEAKPTQDLYARYSNAYKDYEKAIAEYNALYADYKPVYDSYTAYDDYMTAARSKDSVAGILSKSALAGLDQFTSAVTRTLALPEMLLQKLMPGVAMPLTDLADHFSDLRDQSEKERAASVYNRGSITQRASDLASGSVAALPQAALAAMTMGTSAAAPAGTLLTGAGNTGLSASVGNSLKEMAQNPSYWYSVVQTLGSDYEEAKAKGAGDLEALASAIISSALNAKVEIGGGLEALPNAVREGGTDAVREWVKSALDEGKEEVIQSIISGITAKATYDPAREIFSTSNEDAIVNPSRLAEEYAMGAGVGGILGAGQIGAVNVQNRLNDRRIGRLGSDYTDVAQELIDEGLSFDKNTEAYQVSEDLKARMDAGEELSSKDLGRAVIANQRAIELENSNNPAMESNARTQKAPNKSTGSVLESLFAEDEELPSADKMRSAALEMANKTLGKEGKRVFEIAYRDDGNPSVAYGALTRAYNDGLMNRKGTAENITQAQYDAMFQAGRADAAASIKAQANKASSAPVYGGKSGLDFDDADTKAYVEQHVDQKTAKAIDAVSKLLGIKVRFAGSVAGGIANADIENGIVTIEKGNPNPLRFLFGHEITHRMQELAPKEYARLRKAIMAYAPMNEQVEGQQSLYLKNNLYLGNEAALDEVTADYVGKILTDEGELERFIRKVQGDQTLLEKLRDFVHGLAVKLSGSEYEKQILTAEKRLTKALRAAAKQADANTRTQKNTAQDGGVKYSLKMYSQSQVDNWKSSNKIVIYNDVQQLMQFIDDARNNKNLGTKMYFGMVDDALSSEIKANTGLDTLGKNVTLRADNIKKMFKSHGSERTEAPRGQRPITAMDFAEIPNIIGNPDSIYLSQDEYYGKPAIVFEKRIDSSRITLIAVDSGGSLDLFVQTMYAGAKKGSIANVTDVNTPAITSKTSVGTASNENVSQKESFVNTGISYDADTESMSPSGRLSMKTWNASDYVQERKQAASEMASVLGISQNKAMDYIDSVNSIAKMIADDRVRLDYEASPGMSAFVGNVEYGGSIDFSTVCKKRRLFTGTFEAIQNALPNTALTAEEILEIRGMMDKKGYEVSCGLCYVEGSRANMGQYAKQFLDQYAQTNPAYLPNMAEINTPNGLEKIRIQHPEVYAAYESFMNKLAQRKPKLYQLATEYQGEILNKFRKKNGQVKSEDVSEKNANGGIRLQSFSDFEIIHLIDSMQVIMDMSRVGLAGQAYTKVPDFAWALGDTGLKINLSLIAKDVDRNGKLILDEKEGMSEKDAMALRDRYSKNVGTIVVVFTDRQLKAAMADERIDYIIPFHRSQWNKGQYEAMGLPANAKDFTSWQNEAYINPVYNEKGKKQRPENYMPNTYWDFSKSGKENAEAYLKMCAENNRRPKFHYLLVDNQDGSYSLQPDGSTDGYWKTLIDFKMYDNDGKGSPQLPVRPDFNMEQAQRMLSEYTGGHNAFPAAKDVVDEFVRKYKNSHEGTRYSLKEVPPVEPHNGKWTRGSTFDEVKAAHPTLFELDADEAEVRNPTQIVGTVKSYRKIYDTLKAEGFDGTILDASSGLGYGTKAGIEEYGFNVEDIEPFPDASYKPKHTDYSTLDKQYDVIISNAVLNVIPQDLRDAMVVKIGEMLTPGGRAFINVRGTDVKNAGSKVAINEDIMEYFISNTGSYQKGFTKQELVGYLQDALGDGFTVESTNKYGAVAAIVTKDSASFSLKGSEQLVSEIDRIVREGKAQKRSDADIQADIRNAVEEVYQGMLQDYGAIKTGENPARDVQVPERTEKDKKVSQTVRTILEAKATPDAVLPKIEELVATGDFSYDVYTDKAAIADANNSIEHVGWAQALVDWTSAMQKGEVSKKNTATGWALYNNAVNRGDVKTALTVLDYMVKHQRNAAQAVQATRILKKLSPETQLYQVQRSVESLQEELNKRFRGKNAPELKIDQDLAEQYMKAKDQQARDEIMKDIYRDIGRQMPSTFRDKWNAWRYLAMLGNVRTHGRNIIGNAGFAPAVAVKDLTATAIESAVSRVSGGKLNRSKGMVGFSKADRALLSAAWSDFDNVQDMALGGGKYSEFQNANKYIEEGRQVFKFKPLEAARKGNSKALDKEDMWFSRPHYAYAMAQYCKANNITAEQIARGKAIKPARAYAIREAQKATYRDANYLSDAVSKFGRVNDQRNPVKKFAGVVAEGVMPFKKTPANILMRGIEYSPVGFIKGIGEAVWSVKRGTKTGAEAIDAIAAGLTGTGLVALGIFMAAEGLVRGSGGDDDKEKTFEELMGHQAYALEVGGKSVTLDWLAPESIPYFVGVNIWEAMEKDGLTFAEALDTVSMITEPLLEMSMLQSLNDVFEKVGNTYNAGIKGLTAAISDAVTSYLTQALPTILGQAERTGQDVRMTTYTDKNSQLNGDMQYALGTASARIPGIDYNQIPYIDAWGRTESSGGVVERAFNNFLNPAYTSNIDTSEMEEELLRLYDATGEAGVLPKRAAKYFTVDGERKDLTAEEYVQYATLKGQAAYELVTDLVNSQQYKSMSEEDRVNAVKEAYDLANQQAKASISDFQKESWMEKAADAEKKYGISQDVYISLKTQASGIQSLKDKDGETIDNSKGLQIMEMIYDTPGLTEKQRQAMFEYLGVGKSIRHYNKSLVKEKLAKMRKQTK